jgi:hypothetical protein
VNWKFVQDEASGVKGLVDLTKANFIFPAEHDDKWRVCVEYHNDIMIYKYFLLIEFTSQEDVLEYLRHVELTMNRGLQTTVPSPFSRATGDSLE